MSDETNHPTPPAAGETTPPPAPPALPNAEAAELRVLRKKVADAEKAEEDRKKAAMTELDRYKAEAEEAKTKAAKLEREALVTKAAFDAGLPSALWGRVQGSTAEEIAADVASLLSFVKAPAPVPATTGQVPGTATPPATKTPKAEWLALKASDPEAAAKFYQKHRDAIVRE